MKKNVFSRTLAVLASTVVLGAASMVTANAAGATVTLSNETGLPGETVYVYGSISMEKNFRACDLGVGYDSALGADVAEDGDKTVSITSEVLDGNVISVAGYAKPEDGSSASVFVQIPFTIPDDAEPGTVYDITWSEINQVAYVDGDADVDVPIADITAVNGSITVDAPETDAPTEAPTEAPTDAPAVVTTAAATTTAKAATTGAPKTGVTGVAVAVAGLVTAGATAVVLKKRH